MPDTDRKGIEQALKGSEMIARHGGGRPLFRTWWATNHAHRSDVVNVLRGCKWTGSGKVVIEVNGGGKTLAY